MRCPIFCLSWTPDGRRLITGKFSLRFREKNIILEIFINVVISFTKKFKLHILSCLGASSGEFTLWNGLTFNFETILQAHDSPVCMH